MPMLLVAATHLQGRPDTDSIEGAYAAVRDSLGPTVALLFAVGLAMRAGRGSGSRERDAGLAAMRELSWKDFGALVTRLKAEGVEVIYFGGYHPEAGLLVRQLNDIGAKAAVIGGDGL